MKQVIVNIPDNKYQFFMELVQSLDFAKVDETDVPEEHKVIVRERILKSNENPGRLVDWEQEKDNFKLD